MVMFPKVSLSNVSNIRKVKLSTRTVRWATIREQESGGMLQIQLMITANVYNLTTSATNLLQTGL